MPDQSSAPLKALIVDDERLARNELRRVLERFPDRVVVVGEAKNKHEAVQFLANPPDEARPDVIFLDVNMPQGSGFTVLEEIDYMGDNPIHIVFVTAYDEYAVRAFSVNALDYILKPVDPKRLENTLQRIRKLSGKPVLPPTEASPPLEAETQEAFDDDAQPLQKLAPTDYLFLAFGRQRRFVALSDIVCITASGNYTEVWLAEGKRAMMLRTMNEWEEVLPESLFLRIHRATIINCSYLDPSRPMEATGRGALLCLRNIPEPFVVSRRSYAKLRETFL